jgi:hypothetical protein
LKPANLRRKWSAAINKADSNGRTIWIADAHRDAGKRFVERADRILTAFIELEAAIRAAERPQHCRALEIKLDGLSRIK